MPTPLRMLLNVIRLKSDSDNKNHLANLYKFKTKVLSMISNASQQIPATDKSKLATYSMIAFLRCPQLEVSIENFRLIMHVYCLLQINAFGISEKTLVRCGTGLYSPSNLINHSCRPNCVGVFRGRT